MRLREKVNAIKEHYQDLLKTQSSYKRAFYQREAYPMFQNAMAKQFRTSGSSERKNWVIRNKEWAEVKKRLKKKDPSSYPGGARPNIFTGRLLGAASGIASPEFPGTQKGLRNHRKVITNVLTVTIDLDYAYERDQLNNFSDLSEETQKKFEKAIRAFWKREVLK